MKKALSLLLTVVLVLGLMACGKNAQEDAGTAQAANCLDILSQLKQ